MAGHSAASDAEVTTEDRHLKVPVLLIRAEKDCVCLADSMERGPRQWAADLKVASVDAGHWLQLERPGEVNAILENFVRELREGRKNL